jgi:hypothetical protein
MPGPPALTESQRASFTSAPARVVYTSDPRVPYPVLPLQAWGLQYSLDLVLVSDHPAWVMHEYARVDTPAGALWLAKDAGRNREQTITADLPEIASWSPEIPVRRVAGSLDVSANESDGMLDLAIDYTNPAGEPTSVRYRGALPTEPSKPRNGNTMGHSRQSVAALLDLFLFRVGGKAEITIGGETRRLHRLAGLLPERYLLAQVQGGFAVADFEQSPREGGFRLVRPGRDVAWPTRGDEAWSVDGAAISRTGGLTQLVYAFPGGELAEMHVVQSGAGEILSAVLEPRLPDLRRRFEGQVTSRFAIDVGEVSGAGTGKLTARWTGPDRVEVEMVPEAPRWFADRPMKTTIRYDGDRAQVTIDRVDADRR